MRAKTLIQLVTFNEIQKDNASGECNAQLKWVACDQVKHETAKFAHSLHCIDAEVDHALAQSRDRA